jgi:hypothetical protein
MRISLIILCCTLLWCSCTNNSNGIKVIYLEKLDHKGIADIDLQLKPVWYQYALLENPPENIDSLQKVIVRYCDSMVHKSNVEGRYARYFIQFFKYSDKTKSYIQGKDDFFDLHNDISQEMEDYRGEYRYEACQTDTLKGVWSVEVKSAEVFRRDTLQNNCKN